MTKTTKKQAKINTMREELRTVEATMRADTHSDAMMSGLTETARLLRHEIVNLEAPDTYTSEHYGFLIEYLTDKEGVEKERLIIFMNDRDMGRSVFDILEADKGKGGAFFTQRITDIAAGLHPIKNN